MGEAEPARLQPACVLSGLALQPFERLVQRTDPRAPDQLGGAEDHPLPRPPLVSVDGATPGATVSLALQVELPPGLHVQETLPPDAPFTAEDTLVFEVEVLQIAPGMAAMQQLMGPPGAPPEGAVPPEGLVPPDGAAQAPPPGNAQ